MGKLRAMLLAGGILTLGLTNVALAQGVDTSCVTCDGLNSTPGAGGPGFFDWVFKCDPTTGGTVLAEVTSRGQSGTFIAKLNDSVVSFKGRNTILVHIKQGETLTRSITGPDGTYVVGPKSVEWDCPCNLPTTVPTVPASTVPVVATSVPVVPTTSVVATSVAKATTTTIPGELPPTGTNGNPWIPAGALVGAFFGLLMLVHSRPLGDDK